MFVINKLVVEFSASHQLTQLPAWHKCARLHGHNYQVWVELTADELDIDGFVADFAVMGPIKEMINGTLDHRDLNMVMVDPMPTAERLARYLYRLIMDMFHAPTGTTLIYPIGDGKEFCMSTPNNLPQHVRISAVRVSETPSSWAEYRP